MVSHHAILQLIQMSFTAMLLWEPAKQRVMVVSMATAFPPCHTQHFQISDEEFEQLRGAADLVEFMKFEDKERNRPLTAFALRRSLKQSS